MKWDGGKRKPQWKPFTSEDEKSLYSFIKATGGGLVTLSEEEAGDSKKVFHQIQKSASLPDLVEQPNSEGENKIPSEDTLRAGILGFGRVQFPDNNNPSLYLRIPWKHKTLDGLSSHPQALIYFIENVWRLPRPKLLISVTGGALDFDMNPHKEEVLQQLMETARRTNAWLVTGGSRAGIMKYVGTFSKNKRMSIVEDSLLLTH